MRCCVRDALEKALSESERSKSVLLSHLPGLAYRCNYDRDWTMQYVSQGCRPHGLSSESLLYNRDFFNELISPNTAKPCGKNEEFSPPGGLLNMNMGSSPPPAKKWVLEMGQGIYNDDGEVEALEGIVLDISDRKAIEDALKYNNEHDRWTGLYNREYLVSLLEKDASERRI